MSDTSTAITLTPSEVVVLCGDRFVPAGGGLTVKEEVLTSGVKVGVADLMQTAMLAGVLALLRSGAARLETRQGKALFGLIKTKKTHLLRGASPSPFPASSLEGYLAQAAAGEPELDKALSAWIAEDTNDPWSRMCHVVKRGLAERDLLNVERVAKLKIFTTSVFVLPEHTRQAAARAPLDAIKQMIAQAEAGDAETVKTIRGEVESARVFMTESSGG